jgi:hypothetical protein
VFTEAMNGIGKQFVNAKYDEFLRKKSINEVDVPLATDVAIGIGTSFAVLDVASIKLIR